MKKYIFITLLLSSSLSFATSRFVGVFELTSESRKGVSYFFDFAADNTFSYWEAAFGGVSDKCHGEFIYLKQTLTTHLICPSNIAYTQIFDFAGSDTGKIGKGITVKLRTSLMSLKNEYSVNLKQISGELNDL